MIVDFQEELRYQYLGRRDSNKRTIYDADAELGDNERWVRDYHDMAFLYHYITGHAENVGSSAVATLRGCIPTREHAHDTNIDWVNIFNYLDAMDKHPATQQCRQYGSSEQYCVSQYAASNILTSLDNARKVLEPLREELCMDDYTLF